MVRIDPGLPLGIMSRFLPKSMLRICGSSAILLSGHMVGAQAYLKFSSSTSKGPWVDVWRSLVIVANNSGPRVILS